MFSQLLRKARQRGFILPFKKGGGPGAGDGVAYEGATVLEPKIGERWPCVCGGGGGGGGAAARQGVCVWGGGGGG